jgi:hypothetical protein
LCKDGYLGIVTRKIPSNNQITRLLDKVEPEWFAETFNNNLKLAEQYGALDEYRVLDGGVLIALDGCGITHGETYLANTACN